MATDNEISTKELYRIALETRNFEITLFWQRSNYFLVLNTAIAVGFFVSSLRVPLHALLLGIFGLLISVLWLAVNLGSRYWQIRWERRLEIVEATLDDDRGENADKIDFFAASRDVRNQDVVEGLAGGNAVWRLLMWGPLRKPSVSLMMTSLSIMFIFLWALLVALRIAGIDTPTPTDAGSANGGVVMYQ